ncbi:MAG: MFS transporter [Firmicutes bacterium]|nr:MFS transporter [Bacillota bacterium]
MSKLKNALSARNLMLIWVLGMAGQICWNVENQWFNTFVYANIAPDSSIVNWMVAVSAIVTTFSTFFFGTISDRMGKRKPLIAIGYVLWGIFTIIYGLTMYVPHSVTSYLMLASVLLVMADAIMSFFGSMGNDSGFNAWLSDSLNNDNKSAIGTALAVQPVLGTIIGTVLGGMIISLWGYFVFFAIMGGFVILIGIVSIFTMKDAPKLKSYKNGSFWHQFAYAFNVKRFIKMKELMLINVMVTIFFIGFNVYFVHIGNIFIYNYGFNEATFGYIEGAGLILGVLCTIPAGALIKRNKSPLLLAIVFALNIIGLLVLWLFGNLANPTSLMSVANIPLFIGIILIGIGYIITMQVTMVWAKALYPDESRGQFEGIRILFFVLFPMVIGPLIANPIINAYGIPYSHDYGTGPVNGLVPVKELFLVAAIIIVLSYIPLYFVTKLYRERIAKEQAAELANGTPNK